MHIYDYEIDSMNSHTTTHQNDKPRIFIHRKTMKEIPQSDSTSK